MKPNRASIGFIIVLGVFAAAPTVGDIGGCGGTDETLDARKFFAARLELECDRCGECALDTAPCRRACNKSTIVPSTFPTGCRPAVHDGEVCLRALEALSCTRFADVVDPAPIVPTECDFCPERAVEAGQ
jgi:hypothetical protein